MIETLLPCPFCGSQAVIRKNEHSDEGCILFVGCSNTFCHSRIRKNLWFDFTDSSIDYEINKMIKQWNTRKKKMGHWKWLQYDSNPEIGNFHCSECNFIPASFNLANKHLKYCPNCGTRMRENKEEEEKDDRFANSERSEEAPRRDKNV